MDVFISFAAPALVGLIVGLFSGLLGIGGGTVLVPVFRLVFGMSPLMSVATSLFTIIPTSIAGAASHVRKKTVFVSLGVLLGVAGACTSPLGVWLANISPPWAIMVAAAAVIVYAAINMLRKALQAETSKKAASSKTAPTSSAQSSAQASALAEGSSSQSTKSAGPEAAASVETLSEQPETLSLRKDFSRKHWVISIAIGAIAGLFAGYVGVGGGFIMVPLMLAFLNMPMKKASGTSLVAVCILAIPGVVEHGILGNIDYMAGLLIAVGSIPGAIVGARLVSVVPEKALRFIFTGFLLLASALLVYNEFAIIG